MTNHSSEYDTGLKLRPTSLAGEDQVWLIRVRGRVQGVGFRPFIYRIACEYAITGWVENNSQGVLIKASGTGRQLKHFIRAISRRKPWAASVESVSRELVKPERFDQFTIRQSRELSGGITEVGPDIAVCEDCLRDLRDQEHRRDYPLINCTHCGPRFSIIRSIPYDRKNTTMSAYDMCDTCLQEYNDPGNRRFHAQPVACNSCGPQYRLWIPGRKEISMIKAIIENAADLINQGKILAVKGMGGYFLACDALDEAAVQRLRTRKERDAKPFAVMFRDTDQLREYTFCTEEEENAVQSWRRPIVLLPLKKALPRPVNSGLNTVGAFLPYMPVHYMLFDHIRTPALVVTSGNLSEEPIIRDDLQAKQKLDCVADGILSYERSISNRIDDSVVAVVNLKERPYRRSRGYVPQPVYLDVDVEGILATGGELKNCFCIGKDHQAIMSQHIGDLKNLETERFYRETLSVFRELYRFTPDLVVCDLHPDYFSTRLAHELGLPVIRTQHHHAHIVSCMAEHGLKGEVIGISMDGTGYGPDHQIWGGEFLICNRRNFMRFAHFDYIPLPGMDKAVEEPWRMALVYLYRTFGKKLFDLKIPFTEQLDKKKAEAVVYAIDQQINTCLTSSAGRLFDAVSALMNICPVNRFEAEAPMRLESLIDDQCSEKYVINASNPLNFNDVIRQIVSDIQNGTVPSVISARFHHTVVAVFLEMAFRMRDKTGIRRVVLSGGTFQNKFLLSRTEDLLRRKGFQVFSHEQVPMNDGGIALGQLMIGASQRDKVCV